MALQSTALLLGRILLAIVFLHEAWITLTTYSAVEEYMRAFGVPGALLPAAVAIELGGGLLIVLGLRTRSVALVLAAFCVATAVLFHTGPGDQSQALNFEKDLAIAGGFLVLAAQGAGAWAVDASGTRRRRRGGRFNL